VPTDWDAIRAELLEIARGDLTLREDLARDGSLFQGYHPRMEALHQRNAARLAALIDAHGWPGRSRVGEEARRRRGSSCSMRSETRRSCAGA